MVRLGGALLAGLPVLVLAGLLDDREWHGLTLWTKPIKFAIGFALYLMSLGCFAAFIDPAWRQRRVFRVAIFAGLLAIAMEQAMITLQSARGVGSHFNITTAFDAALYSAMGAGSLVLLAMVLPIAWGLARHPGTRPLSASMRHALVAALLLTFGLTLITAGTMAVMGSHRVGAVPGTNEAMAWMGWLRHAGDLRVPHFFATHAMHAVPLAVLMLHPLLRLGQRGVVGVAAIYGAVVLAVFVQALQGHAFLAFIG